MHWTLKHLNASFKYKDVPAVPKTSPDISETSYSSYYPKSESSCVRNTKIHLWRCASGYLSQPQLIGRYSIGRSARLKLNVVAEARIKVCTTARIRLFASQTRGADRTVCVVVDGQERRAVKGGETVVEIG